MTSSESDAEVAGRSAAAEAAPATTAPSAEATAALDAAVQTPATTSAEAAVHPRFAAALREAGLGALLTRVRQFPEATRTAAEAAAAIGCELNRICKSLVFAADGDPVLVLMDGASRVDVELVRRELAAGKVTRARADLVRDTTGYAIGGVPPFGHRTKTRVLADRSLLGHEIIWAAAGTPYSVFPMDPESLIAHAGAALVDVREQSA